MNKYVVNMLAKPKNVTTSQVKGGVDRVIDDYLKNSYLCLSSVLDSNPDIIAILCLNFKLNSDWENRFKNKGVHLELVEFGEHSINESFSWSIVQYRYDVIKHLINILDDDDLFVMLDTDVICVSSLDGLFRDSRESMCFFDVQHSIDHRDRKNILDNYLKIYPDREHIELTHYGGEILSGTVEKYRVLLAECENVINDANKISNLVNFNDEHITSIAIDNLYGKLKVHNANAYIYRYWTVQEFILTSTNYVSNAVSLWHLPSEKQSGMLEIYEYYMKHNQTPSVDRMSKIFGFPRVKRYSALNYFFIRIKKRLGAYR